MRVLCNNEKCEHWKACEPQKLMYGHRGEGLSTYSGECTRQQDDGQQVMGLLVKEIVQGGVKMVIPECQCFSKLGISGHMNFSRLLNPNGTPQGGQIPDPIPGDTAYHT